VRSYSSFWDAAREVVDARVFGGIHFRRTCVISNEVAEKIGKFAVKSHMQPIRRQLGNFGKKACEEDGGIGVRSIHSEAFTIERRLAMLNYEERIPLLYI
jgi:hypothetical protein